RNEFAWRLRWSAWMHALLERPALCRPTLALLGAWPAGFQYIMRRTRGAPLDPPARTRTERR
ncbi:MAG: hypothetical protein ACE5G2_10310, partial [Candidatus Krumholzibacteriia bacterium]